ncbi:MAG: hypothetical protein PHX13_05600 [Thiovulaceae bacterium]|nr:hypothetical protein [Sulfurimonadaceae bacterium]
MLKIQKTFFILLLSVTALFAESNVHQIYQTMASGHMDEAHKMIEEVLQKHPDSAKAHFVDAEILVRQGNKKAAHDELAIAEQLSPGLPFAKPDAVVSLKKMIEGNIVSTSSSTQMPQNIQNTQEKKSNGFPWMTFLLTGGVVFLVVMIWKSFSGRKQNQYNQAPTYGNNTAPQQSGYPNNPYNQGNPVNQGGSGLGSNIMSGLATGAAAGVGMVAAEELMHHFTDHNDSASNNSSMFSNDNNTMQPSNDMGDTDFGISDGSSWDDNSSGGDDDSSW